MMNPEELARLERLEHLVARTTSGGILMGGDSTVVWRPGVPSAGNIFDTWPEVVVAVSVLPGDITIAVDDSIAPAIIPAGSWDLRPSGISGPVTFVRGVEDFGPIITIANAPVEIRGLTGIDSVLIDNQSTTDVIISARANNTVFEMRGVAAIFQNVLSGGAAFFAVAAGLTTAGFMTIIMNDAAFISTLDTGVNCIQVTVNGNLSLFINDGSTLDTAQLFSSGIAQTSVTVTGHAPPGFVSYETQPAAASVLPTGFEENGSDAIDGLTGKSALITAFIGPNTRIECTQSVSSGDGGANPTVRYASLTVDRVPGNPGTFQISALTNVGGGNVNLTDASTVDWEVIN